MIYRVATKTKESFNTFIEKLSELFKVDSVRVFGDFDTKEGYVNGVSYGYELSKDFTVKIENKKYEVLPIEDTIFVVDFEMKEILELPLSKKDVVNTNLENNLVEYSNYLIHSENGMLDICKNSREVAREFLNQKN